MSSRRLPYLVALVLVSIGGCGGGGSTDDAGTIDGGPVDAAVCHTDADCDDGLVCDGTERCASGVCLAGPALRCDDGIACTVDFCSEAMRACAVRVPDADGDGVGDRTCADVTGTPLGQDCDDADGNRFPGNHEVCDDADHDEDCDTTTHGGVDSDADGFEDARCCNGTDCGDDCDDAHASAHPGATEACNLVDDDCDTRIDEMAGSAGFVDADRDGYGDPAHPMTACVTAAGFAADGTDCDDASPARNPGQVEFCDSVDNDCDTTVDEDASAVSWYVDRDGDGFGSAASGTTTSCVPPAGYVLRGTDCNDAAAGVSPASPETCNGVDDDCNGTADFVIAAGNLEDDDGDGIADAMCGPPLGRDCDDRDASSGPGSGETCDGRDNDCDGRVDEGAAQTAFFRDSDGDGYGDSRSVRVGCTQPMGFVRRGGDCNDTNDTVHPGATEQCGDDPTPVDQDCDGATDEAPAALSCTAIPGNTMACIANHCATAGCETGYADCAPAPGCETNVTTSPDHCGSCAPCSAAFSSCTAGTCGPATASLAALAGGTGDVRVDAVVLVPGSTDVVLGGAFTGSLVLDGNTLVSAGGFDGFAARIRSDGTAVFVSQWGGAGDDAIHAIAVAPDASGMAIGGEMCDATLCGGPITGCYGFWQRFVGGVGCDYADGIAATTSAITALAIEQAGGETYVYGAGHFTGTGNHGVGASSGGVDGFVFRAREVFGNQPTYEWVRTYTGIYDDVPLDLALLGASQLVVGGVTSSSADFGLGPTGHAGYDDGFVAVMNRTTGVTAHAVQIGTSVGYDRVERVVALPNGTVAIAGVYANASLVYGSIVLPGAGPANLFVVNLSAILGPQWGAGFQGSGDVGSLGVLGNDVLFGADVLGGATFDRGTISAVTNAAVLARLSGLSGATVFARVASGVGPSRTGGAAVRPDGSIVWEIDHAGPLTVDGQSLPSVPDLDLATVVVTP